MRTTVYDAEADTLLAASDSIDLAIIKAQQNVEAGALGTPSRLYWKAVVSILRRRRNEAMAEKRRNPE